MSATYRPEIDGLRALAVLPVILFHAGFPGFEGGYIGVDIFFVISGYLITSLLVSELKESKFSFRTFYERRARRIFPALFFVVLCCLPVAWAWLPPDGFRNFSQSVTAVSFFSSNILFWAESGYFDTANEVKPLLHTWSLGIEEQFYLIYPLVLFIGWRFFRSKLPYVVAAILLASLILSELISRWSPEAGFYLLPTRGWELMAGAILAIPNKAKRLRVNHHVTQLIAAAGLLLIGLSVVAFDGETNHPGVATILPTLGTVLVIAFGNAKGVVHGILSNRVLVYIGLISYSLYLWHQPAFAFARIYLGQEPGPYQYGALIAASFALSALSFRFIERPMRNRKGVSARTVWRLSAISVLSLSSFGCVGHLSNGWPSRFELNYVFAAKLDTRCANRRPEDACVLGDAQRVPTWALVGDSHAGVLAETVDELLKAREAAGFQITTPGCSYAPGLKKFGTQPENCYVVNRHVRDFLLASPRIQNVIISGRYVLHLRGTGFDNREGGREQGGESWYGDGISTGPERRTKVLRAYQNAISELLDANKTVILVYPVPEIGWDVESEMYSRTYRGKNPEISTAASLYYARSRAVIHAFDALGNHENLIRIRPGRILCDSFLPDRCATVRDARVLYRDDHHVSPYGAHMLLDIGFDIWDQRYGTTMYAAEEE